ncbi:MAG: hypothetical protein ACLGGX_06450 [Bdellovibrionia bacterium]
MRNLDLKTTLVLATSLLLAVGCAKESKSTSNTGTNATTPIVGGSGVGAVVTPPTGTGGTGTTVTPGGTGITFSPVSLEEFNTYVATRPLNYPTDFKIALNLKNDGNNKFYGDVRISYTDVGRRYEGVFKADNAKNVSMSGLRDSGLSDANYNYWFMSGGQKVFSGFFEDDIGGIVLVIDEVVNQNDGQGGSIIGGEIWYRNFAQTLAPKSPYRSCWYVYTGPYDCRSNHVIQKTSIYPSDSYRKLGRFSGYVQSQAFQ